MKRVSLFIAVLFLCGPVFATCDFKADTATTYTIRLLDGTDGITAETTPTPAQADIRLWKEGGTTAAQKNDSTGCTHRESGLFTCPLDTTDTNTEGVLHIFTDDSIDAISIVPWDEKCNVLGAAEYDRKYGTTAQLTALQTGVRLDSTIGSVTSQLIFVLAASPAPATNNDAYGIGTPVVFRGGGEECERAVEDWVGGTRTLTIDLACDNMTVAASDQVLLYVGLSARAQVELDIGVGSLTDGVRVGTGGMAQTSYQTGAMDEDALDPTFTAEIADALHNVLVATTIATLTTQSDFTLTVGSTDNNAYNNRIVIVIDSATATQKAVGQIRDYVGSTKQVILKFNPGVFTMATGDTVVILSNEF